MGDSIDRLAREVARGIAGPGASDADRSHHERRVRAVLAGQQTLPVARYVQVRRQEDGETAPNGEPFHVQIKASTEGVARDGGVVPLSAWEDGGLANFRKNPVVMLAHGREFPIGRSVHDELDPDANALVAFWEFHEENEESRLARRLYEGGWMRAASVGFRILSFHSPEEEELEELQEKFGTEQEIHWVADRAELLEQSAVSVPADPDALTTAEFGKAVQNARAHGVDVNPLVERVAALAESCRAGDSGACERLEELTADGGGRSAPAKIEGDGSGEQERGQELGARLTEAIQDQADEDDLTVQEVVGQLAERAGVDVATVTADANGENECPPFDRLEAYADELNTVETAELVQAGEADGCEYDRAGSGDDAPVREVISFAEAHEPGSYSVAEQDAEWDAADEVAAMEASEEVLERRHAWRDPDADPDTKTTYKFPHHRAAANAAVVFRALAQIFARIGQADIPSADEDGVLDHAARHYRADFDEEPPEREAVAAAVREWPDERHPWESKRQAQARVETYIEKHGETLKRLGGGDMKIAAEVVEEVAREQEEGDEEQELSTEERVARLEQGLVELRDSMADLHESMQEVREAVREEGSGEEPESGSGEEAGDEGAGEGAAGGTGSGEEPEGEEQEEPEGEEQEEPEGEPSPEHELGFDPKNIEVTEDEETGERLALIPRSGDEDPIGIPLEEGEDAREVVSEAIETGFLRARGAALPRGE